MEENKKQFKGRKGDRREKTDKSFEEKEFDSVILDLARVTRVTKGGKRMRFRAAVVLGDRKGRLGFGIAKGADVALAVSKATRLAKKSLFKIIFAKTTIPHWIEAKEKAAKVLLKPAPAGSGIIAGGAMRVVLELGGVPDVVGKMLGANNKVNNARATIKALASLKPRTEKSKK